MSLNKRETASVPERTSRELPALDLRSLRNCLVRSKLNKTGASQMEVRMAPRESEPQKETVERVMHEFKHGELRSGTSGQKVKNRKQAVAIALSEAGACNQQTSKENEQQLRHTKAKE